jgi:hypothetical protein
MLIFADTGPKSVCDDDVLLAYRGGGDGRYTHQYALQASPRMTKYNPQMTLINSGLISRNHR